MRGLGAALALLTRVPIGVEVGDEDLSRSVPWFPLVGAAIGLALAGLYLALYQVLPALPAAAVTVAAGVALTGAFHEDGLADAFDGIAGGRSPEDALRIMREPTLGSFGVSALVVGIVVRVAAVSALSPEAGLVALPVAHLSARAGIVVTMAGYPAASRSGLAAAHRDRSMRRHAVVAVAFTSVAAGLVAGWVGIGVVIASLAAALLVGLVATRRVGGTTGDVLGASEQAAEALALVLFASTISLP